MRPADSPVVVASDLRPVVRLGVMRFDGLDVRPTAAHDDPIQIDLAMLEEVARARVPLVRAMYRGLGLDPTKTRPSSEALLRRVRAGRRWPHVNTLVDAGNRCSLETQLPFGLYDTDQIVGPIEFRLGTAPDEYVGIGKPVVHLDGRPALFDDRGPFGNPTADSARTMITSRTTRVLVVIFGPQAVSPAGLEAALDLTAGRLLNPGVRAEGRWIEPCE